MWLLQPETATIAACYGLKPAVGAGWSFGNRKDALFGVFALVEGGVGDLFEHGGVARQRADMAPVDVVRRAVEVIVAEGA